MVHLLDEVSCIIPQLPAAELQKFAPKTETVAGDYGMKPLSSLSLKQPLLFVRSHMEELLKHPDIWDCYVVMIEECREQIRLSLSGHYLYKVFPDFHKILPGGRIDLNRFERVTQLGIRPAFHWHQWPIIVWVHHRPKSFYRLGIGSGGTTFQPPPIACTGTFSGPAYYEMTHVSGAHFLEPIGGPSYSTAVVGIPWEQQNTSFGPKYSEISSVRQSSVHEKTDMLGEYREMYRQEILDGVDRIILAD